MNFKEEIEFKWMYKNDIESTMNQMITYLRHLEKTNKTGVLSLFDLVKDGYMTFDKALDILPAVKNYDIPYELKLI